MKKEQHSGNYSTDVRIVLIEDDSTIRESYSYLINKVEGLHVVNSYSSYEEADPGLQSDAPDVILLDVELPGINGVEAIIKILKKLPAVHIIILTVYENEATIFKALNKGASGYLTKKSSTNKITEAIKEVVQGGGPMSAGIARMVINSFRKNINSPLTKRETEVLEAIAEGKNRSKIAASLFIDIETVKTHMKKIYHKLNANSKDEAIMIARKQKLI